MEEISGYLPKRITLSMEMYCHIDLGGVISTCRFIAKKFIFPITWSKSLSRCYGSMNSGNTTFQVNVITSLVLHFCL